ncbi:hypothetical protein BTO02_20470 [Paraburkholderia sp. SOS3]|nr:hypothetical protein BTO02_20470 [Paraburkholderia sp. SOS3]
MRSAIIAETTTRRLLSLAARCLCITAYEARKRRQWVWPGPRRPERLPAESLDQATASAG